jgi:hypothetical protein
MEGWNGANHCFNRMHEGSQWWGKWCGGNNKITQDKVII